ncbi:MAG: inorganic phosphate transporter [Terrimesophilobacter sp.]
MDAPLMVTLVIALALFFDFTNGFHDTANSMATPIATGALKPKVAVSIAAVLNLVGAFLSTEVARTISGGLIREGNGGIQITPQMIFAGLIGAIVWNLATWLFGLPSSSSHALFGGLVGAVIVGAGFGAINPTVLVDKIVLPALLAPLIACSVAFLATKLALAITSGPNAQQNRARFRYGQTFTASLVSLAHGTNDAQKTMGIVTLTLIAAGFQASGSGPAFWVIAVCALAIALGTYVGGWRIIRTLGTGITQITPAQGFAAEAATSAAILASSHLGFALSTTQVASGSVIGAGLGWNRSSVRWRVAGRIAMAWLITLPTAAVVAAVAELVARLGFWGVVVDVCAVTGVSIAMFARSRRHRVDAASVAPGTRDVAAPMRDAASIGASSHRARRPQSAARGTVRTR